ncbi:hypothetical protein [Adhaeribacter pallidiroseus]|uniref:Uncharacterized protein n=1 Tax=Adhaeribacter pallidiroseus TaxID=2072847 RepID=A0A369QNT9_9BACT|nr:hypothetical protein [Adhaeribacter pallidiroseus]RDC64927.1 hypothetical protein AHMF7616_03549 [Adhaeribacter pallidiroseus]
MFPARQVLSLEDIALANRGWNAYATETPEALVYFLQTEDFSRLPLLPKALQAHLTRFPSVQNGLNAMEQLLLAPAADHNLLLIELMEEYWQRTSLFGIGDAQIINYLQELEQAGLIQLQEKITVTALGFKILRAEADYGQ